MRNRLEKLEKTGEIGRQKGNQYSIITINKYDDYQIADIEEGKPGGKQRANKGQAKGNKQEYKNDKNKNKEKI